MNNWKRCGRERWWPTWDTIQNLPGMSEEIHEKSQSGLSLSRPKFKPGTFRTQIRSVITGTSLLCKELHGLYSIDRVVKSRLGWAAHSARIGDTRNACTILTEKYFRKQALRRRDLTKRERWSSVSIYQTTRRHTAEDSTVDSHRHENP
jgi:hypothetical protein